MITQRERVSKALDRLTEGLEPFVEQELKRVYKDRWAESVNSSFRNARGRNGSNDGGRNGRNGKNIQWDAHSLLTVMWDQWHPVFRSSLSTFERSLVSELRDFRNRWAHQESFNFDDTYRMLDSTERLLTAAKAPELDTVTRSKSELLHAQFSKQMSDIRENTRLIRRRWLNVIVYTACFLSVVFVVGVLMMSATKWLFCFAAALTWGYLLYNEFSEQPRLVGPHECQRCRRIIYAEYCPYCEK